MQPCGFYQTSYFPSDLQVGGRTDKDNSLNYNIEDSVFIYIIIYLAY